MAKALLVVESPAKVRTIRRYVGKEFVIKASVGHVIDLPGAKLAVDVADGFRPKYDVIHGKEKVLQEIEEAARNVETVFLAPDPDREGEAIAHHIARHLREHGVTTLVRRVLFNEITKGGIERGLANPTEIDQHKFESQQARRILDRLVGYELSPVLWKKIQRGLSAGRVQSAALRIIVERELAIRAFVAEEYWHLFASMAPEATAPGGTFRAQLVRVDGEAPKVKSGDDAARIRGELERAKYRVGKVEERPRRRNPLPPYVTSRLQQDASARFRFPAKRTMSAAQALYEGVDVGNGGPTGLITYMRTDSTRVSEGAVVACREFIASAYGADAVPPKPNIYRSRAGAQDAHEAIRPTDATLTPERAAPHLTPDQAKIYGLVWRRFVASQMKPAVYAVTTLDVDAVPPDLPGRTLRLRATCSRLVDRGFLAAFDVPAEDDDPKDGEGANGGTPAPAAKAPAKAPDPQLPSDEGCAATALPQVKEGETLVLVPPGVAADQKFTQPPARYTEGSLIREMEELGIGRPSTYAATVSTVIERRYVRKDEQKLVPTELGELVNERLVRHFPGIVNTEFTAKMETELDRVEDWSMDWRRLLEDFYGPFHDDVEKAMKEMESVRGQKQETDEVCPECGKAKLLLRWGRAGKFLACSRYPKCKFTKDAPDAGGSGSAAPLPVIEGEVCENCGKPMKVRRGRFGAFLACTGYPKCKTTKPLPTGVKCPKPGCGGSLVERRTKQRRSFWGCSNHQKAGCDFVVWRKPVPAKCPQCGAEFLVEAKARGSVTLACATDGCGYKAAPGGEPGDGQA